MTFQRTLNVGDIVTVKKAKAHALVVRSERRVSPAPDGNYWVDEIDVVEIATDRWGKPMQTMQYTEPKIQSYYFEGAPMTGKGRCIKDSDITVVGTSKVSTYITTTHVMENIHYYGNT